MLASLEPAALAQCFEAVAAGLEVSDGDGTCVGLYFMHCALPRFLTHNVDFERDFERYSPWPRPCASAASAMSTQTESTRHRHTHARTHAQAHTCWAHSTPHSSHQPVLPSSCPTQPGVVVAHQNHRWLAVPTPRSAVSNPMQSAYVRPFAMSLESPVWHSR